MVPFGGVDDVVVAASVAVEPTIGVVSAAAVVVADADVVVVVVVVVVADAVVVVVVVVVIAVVGVADCTRSTFLGEKFFCRNNLISLSTILLE